MNSLSPLCVLLLLPFAFSAEVVVSQQNGTDATGCGRLLSPPCRSIGVGLQQCQAGDILLIGPGHFFESSLLVTVPISIIGAGRHLTYLSCSQSQNSSSHPLELTVPPTRPSLPPGFVVSVDEFINDWALSFINISFSFCGQSITVPMPTFSSPASGNVTVGSCSFRSCFSTLAVLNVANELGHIQIEDCVFEGNEAVSSGEHLASIALLNSQGLSVTRCVFSSNAGGYGMLSITTARLSMSSTVFEHNTGGMGLDSSIVSVGSQYAAGTHIFRSCAWLSNTCNGCSTTLLGDSVIQFFGCTWINNTCENPFDPIAGAALRILMSGDPLPVLVDSCTLEGNGFSGIAQMAGGAFSLTGSNGNLTILSSIFRYNRSPTTAGAIQVGASSIVLRNTSFERNVAAKGGGGAVEIVESTQDLLVDQCRFVYNTASGPGGAMFLHSEFVSVHVVGSEWIGNRAERSTNTGSDGGAIALGVSKPSTVNNFYAADLRFIGGIWTDNHATNHGGAISYYQDNKPPTWISSASVLFSGLTMMENTADANGGAIWIFPISAASPLRSVNSSGTSGARQLPYIQRSSDVATLAVVVQGSIFRDNHANNGGAVAVNATLELSVSANLRENYWQGNSALRYGGALLVNNIDECVLNEERFENHHAGCGGGCLTAGVTSSASATATLLAVGVLVRNSSAVERGGAFHLSGWLEVNLTHCSFLDVHAGSLPPPAYSGPIPISLQRLPSALVSGGAIELCDCERTLLSLCTLRGATADFGGAISCRRVLKTITSALLVLSQCLIEDSIGHGYRGALSALRGYPEQPPINLFSNCTEKAIVSPSGLIVRLDNCQIGTTNLEAPSGTGPLLLAPEPNRDGAYVAGTLLTFRTLAMDSCGTPFAHGFVPYTQMDMFEVTALSADGQHTLQLTPTENGSYTDTVLAETAARGLQLQLYLDQQASGDPLSNLTIVSATTDAGTSQALGIPPLLQMLCTDLELSFEVQASDRFGNPQTQQLDTWSVYLVPTTPLGCETSAVTNASISAVGTPRDGTFSGLYVAQSFLQHPGSFLVCVFLEQERQAGVPISGSPFSLQVLENSVRIAAVRPQFGTELVAGLPWAVEVAFRSAAACAGSTSCTSALLTWQQSVPGQPLDGTPPPVWLGESSCDGVTGIFSVAGTLVTLRAQYLLGLFLNTSLVDQREIEVMPGVSDARASAVLGSAVASPSLVRYTYYTLEVQVEDRFQNFGTCSTATGSSLAASVFGAESIFLGAPQNCTGYGRWFWPQLSFTTQGIVQIQTTLRGRVIDTVSKLIVCEAGTSLVGEHCIPCPVGSYSSSGSEDCLSCPTCWTTANTGATSAASCDLCSDQCISTGSQCLPCPLHSQRAPQGDRCLCAVNYYFDTPTRTCLSCPIGSSTRGMVGATNITQCICGCGSYGQLLEVDDQDSQCYSCAGEPDVGAQAEEATAPSQTSFGVCTSNQTRCQGGTECNIAYAGTLCRGCADGYHPIFEECVACHASLVGFGALLGVAFLAMCLLMVTRSGSVLLDVIQAVSGYARITAVLVELNVAWPSAVLAVYWLLSLFNMNLQLLFPLCAGGEHASYWTWLGTLLLPWLAIFLIALYYLFRAAVLSFATSELRPGVDSASVTLLWPGHNEDYLSDTPQMRSGNSHHEFEMPIGEDDIEPPGRQRGTGSRELLARYEVENDESSTDECHSDEEADIAYDDGDWGQQRTSTESVSLLPDSIGPEVNSWDLFIGSSLGTLSWLYVSLNEASMEPFSCELLAGRLVMRSEPEVECFGSEWTRLYLGPALAGLLFYSAGIPLFFAVLLFRNRHRLQHPRVATRLSHLCGEFKPKFFWWEAWEKVQELFIVAVVFFVRNTAIQISMVGFAAVLALALLFARQPYHHAHLNWVQVTLNFLKYLFISAASLLLADSQSEAARVSAIVLIAVGVGVPLLMVAFFAARAIIQHRKASVDSPSSQ